MNTPCVLQVPSNSIGTIKSCEQVTPLSRWLAPSHPAIAETVLQQIIDAHPGFLPLRDFLPNVTTACSLGRELPLRLGETTGYVDNLLVTDDGHLVLVETKLRRNPEAVREVVAQTIEYALALQELTIGELEACLRKSAPLNRFGANETIVERARTCSMVSMRDDFEARLEQFHADGELLLLIVTDGVRPSVEKMSRWLNAKVGVRAVQIGIVDLQFFALPDGRPMAIAKSVGRTTEIARQVVTIRLQGNLNATAEATLLTGGEEAGWSTSKIPQQKPPMTRQTLLADVSEAERPALKGLLQILDELGLSEGNPGPTTLNYGIENERGELFPFVYLYKNGMQGVWTKALYDLTGAEPMRQYRHALNEAATFYTYDKIEGSSSIWGKLVPYKALVGREEELTRAMTLARNSARAALRLNASSVP